MTNPIILAVTLLLATLLTTASAQASPLTPVITGPTSASLGGPLTYVVTVQNDGAKYAGEVVKVSRPGWIYPSVTSSPNLHCTWTPRRFSQPPYVCTGTLAPGELAWVAVNGTAITYTPITMTAVNTAGRVSVTTNIV